MDIILPEPGASGEDETFERIWQIRDDIVRQVWGQFNEVYVQRDTAAENGAYIYLTEIPPEAQAIPAQRWTYVTGGLSLPWTADLSAVNVDDYSVTNYQVTATQLAAAAVQGIDLSGQGFEVVLNTPDEASWAVDLLHNLGTYVLSTGDGFASGHRVPLNGPIIRDSDSELQVLLFAPPSDRAPLFRLPSGFVQWLVAIGITLDEWEYAQREGSAALVAALREHGVGDLTDPQRHSIFAG
jgi:hypothetical protein